MSSSDHPPGYSCGDRPRDIRYSDDRRSALREFSRFLRLVVMQAIDNWVGDAGLDQRKARKLIFSHAVQKASYEES